MTWFGSWRDELPDPLLWVVVVFAASTAGALLGYERERKDKPAGLKTMALISVGAAVFTALSYHLAEGWSDVTRVAAQVIPGIGFLGAGAILRERGIVVGLTTAATIWVSAALGMVIGGGYVPLGILLALMVLVLHVLVARVEGALYGRCEYTTLRARYRPEGGRTILRIRHVLDEHRFDPELAVTEAGEEECVLELRVCSVHRNHRRFLGDLAELSSVLSLEGPAVLDAGARHSERPAPRAPRQRTVRE